MKIYAFTSCFFFNDTATTEIYTLSLHDALPIFPAGPPDGGGSGRPAAHPYPEFPQPWHDPHGRQPGLRPIDPRAPGPPAAIRSPGAGPRPQDRRPDAGRRASTGG